MLHQENVDPSRPPNFIKQEIKSHPFSVKMPPITDSNMIRAVIPGFPLTPLGTIHPDVSLLTIPPTRHHLITLSTLEIYSGTNNHYDLTSCINNKIGTNQLPGATKDQTSGL